MSERTFLVGKREKDLPASCRCPRGSIARRGIVLGAETNRRQGGEFCLRMQEGSLREMLGFGAIGEQAIGAAGYNTRALTSDILQQVVTQLVDVDKVLPALPPRLHHFTSLGTAAQIIEKDNARLSHAEYSNDQTEMAQAKEIITSALSSRSGQRFFVDVLTEYQNRSQDLDAYIFCMSMDKPNVGQDILSQWRAYGQDGRGVALTLDARELSRLIQNVPAMRINPVIYDSSVQQAFVDRVLTVGLASASTSPNAVDATAAALVFATPLMKAAGFEEEGEWRLVFMPPAKRLGTLLPTIGFYSRPNISAFICTSLIGIVSSDFNPRLIVDFGILRHLLSSLA
jgi:hypothetical protein